LEQAVDEIVDEMTHISSTGCGQAATTLTGVVMLVANACHDWGI
jgi:hypothetical protein